MEIYTSQVVGYMSSIIEAKLVPFLKSSPGQGKSDLTRELAKKYKLKVIDLRLSQCDPTDLNNQYL